MRQQRGGGVVFHSVLIHVSDHRTYKRCRAVNLSQLRLSSLLKQIAFIASVFSSNNPCKKSPTIILFDFQLLYLQ